MRLERADKAVAAAAEKAAAAEVEKAAAEEALIVAEVEKAAADALVVAERERQATEIKVIRGHMAGLRRINKSLNRCRGHWKGLKTRGPEVCFVYFILF